MEQLIFFNDMNDNGNIEKDFAENGQLSDFGKIQEREEEKVVGAKFAPTTIIDKEIQDDQALDIARTIYSVFGGGNIQEIIDTKNNKILYKHK
jgi:hypothetical protein